MKNISIILFLIGIFHFSGCETAPLYRGYRWYRRGNYEQSIRTFTYYLEHSSDNSGNNEEERAAAYFYRGLSKTELGRGQEAVTDYKEALSRVPDFFYASFNLGVEYIRQQRYEMALQSFRTSWNSILKARRGELDESRLWNRNAFQQDGAYCFYYYGITIVMCGKIDELDSLLREGEVFAFNDKNIFSAREIFKRIVSESLTAEEGREFLKPKLEEIEKDSFNNRIGSGIITVRIE